MASIRVKTEFDLDSPTLVEGLPGVGLVGKIATDHLVDTFDMTYVASVDCQNIPRVSVYEADRREVFPPVRLYADESRDLLALQSDVPLARDGGGEFADCITEWLEDTNATPLYLSGLPVQDLDHSTLPDVFGIGSGDGAERLDAHDIDTPPERGLVSGPTGALINRAAEHGLDAVGLVVESDAQFPDPAAAKRLLDAAIEPLAGVDVPTEDLVEEAEQIREQKKRLAERMQEAEEDESTQARPMRMFQ
ncbi:proteasome assembly chaperone family protein [Halobacterium sp. CBA1126]|uniref:proteasome assembly chaperone family protein n=1 Tax=Halobacterium sp. CBA1126 TaxID=2668074 RepID=UPI0012F89FA4|nr:proteasome assembly chaperone family protein [Halobacterium sp. CBA1126]MUV60222.1 proteasome assembly chaperone family protein [Halobacterium sp. CBA1126]